MSSGGIFSRFSIFSYSNLGRINGEEYINNSCGGVLTVLVIAVMAITAGLKVSEMFRKTTIVAKTSQGMNLIPPMINIITSNDGITAHFPYMLGIGVYADSPLKARSIITAEYQQVQRDSDFNRVANRTNITLEKCTTTHFSVIPDIETKAKEWGLTSWLCLPINLTFEVGGSYWLSPTYKRLQLNISCNPTQTSQDCGQFLLYTLSRFVDPSGQQPSTYYLNQDNIIVKPNEGYVFSSNINLNHLIVDESLMPNKNLVETSGVETEALVLRVVDSTMLQTQVEIEVGYKQTKHNRSYMKVLDVISYMGGIFNAVLAAGILISGFNKYHFEIKFANRYFRKNSQQRVTFFGYLKTTIYGIIEGTPLEPNWEAIKRQRQKISAVNKIMDVINLNKRIVFLEQALNVLFEKRQIKALHLINSLTMQEAMQRIENHKLRERLLYFIASTNTKTKDRGLEGIQSNSQKHLEQNKQNKIEINTEKNFVQQHAALPNVQISRQHLNLDKPPASNFDELPDFLRGSMSDALQRNQQMMISSQPKTCKALNSNGFKKKSTTEYEIEHIGELPQQILRKDELIADIDTDLRHFIEEANAGSNPITSQIYSRIDFWLKQQMKQLIRPKQLAQNHQKRLVEKLNLLVDQ